jgi:hypothetical protein
VIRGTTVITPEPIPEKELEKLKANIMNLAGRFNKRLNEEKPIKSSLFKIMTFRMTRSGLQSSDLKLYDYEYYKEKGWLKSGYYYDIRLGPIQRVVGRFSDFLGRKLFI